MKLRFVDVDEGAQSDGDASDFVPQRGARLSWTRPAATTSDIAPGEYVVAAVSYEVSSEGTAAVVLLRNQQLVSLLR